MLSIYVLLKNIAKNKKHAHATKLYFESSLNKNKKNKLKQIPDK